MVVVKRLDAQGLQLCRKVLLDGVAPELAPDVEACCVDDFLLAALIEALDEHVGLSKSNFVHSSRAHRQPDDVLGQRDPIILIIFILSIHALRQGFPVLLHQTFWLILLLLDGGRSSHSAICIDQLSSPLPSFLFLQKFAERPINLYDQQMFVLLFVGIRAPVLRGIECHLSMREAARLPKAALIVIPMIFTITIRQQLQAWIQ